MAKRLIFAVLATAFVLASVAEATALDRNSAARTKSRTSAAATSPKETGFCRRPASENNEYLPVQRHSKGPVLSPRSGEKSASKHSRRCGIVEADARPNWREFNAEGAGRPGVL